MTPVPHNRLTHGELECAAVAKAVASGRWADGSESACLESELAGYVGRKHAAVVGSGMGALRLALLALKVGRGDEVVVPAYSCVALPNAVLACGARPVVADVSREGWVINLESLANVVTSKTRAVVAVHTFGFPANIRALLSSGIPVVEDCAHGFSPNLMGLSGTLAITSFYATKLIGAGEGGAVITDRDTCDGFVRQWRDYSDQGPSKTRHNDKMSELSAALARVQLGRLPEMVASRDRLATRYLESLASLDDEGLIRLPAFNQERIWYRFTIEVLTGDARSWQAELRKYGIEAESPIWDWRRDIDRTRVSPVVDAAYKNCVSLPLYPTLTPEEQQRVIEGVETVARALV